MNRTQIYLPKKQTAALRQEAVRTHDSLSQVIRNIIERHLERVQPKPLKKHEDLLTAAKRINRLVSKKAPKDLASNLDAYLYGGK